MGHRARCRGLAILPGARQRVRPWASPGIGSRKVSVVQRLLFRGCPPGGVEDRQLRRVAHDPRQLGNTERGQSVRGEQAQQLHWSRRIHPVLRNSFMQVLHYFRSKRYMNVKVTSSRISCYNRVRMQRSGGRSRNIKEWSAYLFY